MRVAVLSLASLASAGTPATPAEQVASLQEDVVGLQSRGQAATQAANAMKADTETRRKNVLWEEGWERWSLIFAWCLMSCGSHSGLIAQKCRWQYFVVRTLCLPNACDSWAAPDSGAAEVHQRKQGVRAGH